MRYYSTNNKKIMATLEEAVLQGLAPDGGLYMPDYLESWNKDFFEGQLYDTEPSQLCYLIARKLLDQSIPDSALKEICKSAINFKTPLVEIKDNLSILELFHGPTLAFKDYGARFMAGLLSFFLQKKNSSVKIIVATSGDTGSAVANAFYQMPNISVIVLYPKGKVSSLQEKQITTLGQNIHALEVDGTFDDCQKLVKTALADCELNNQNLTSANSINIARLIPQVFYYFLAYQQIPLKKRKIIFSVPSGNFGNLTAGLVAKKLGLPIDIFLAATNINDTVPRYLQSGIFTPCSSKLTISNAMDVGNPSNFFRILDLYNHDFELIKKDIVGLSCNDAETKACILEVYNSLNYLADPHTAVGVLAFNKYQVNLSEDCYGVILATAHPAKFIDVIEPLIGKSVELPNSLKQALAKNKQSTALKVDYNHFKEFITNLK